jgi:hypothetical protein
MVVIHNRECLVLADQRRLVIGRIRPRAPSELLHAGQSGFNLALVKELISIHSGRIFTYASGSTNLDLMSRSMLSLLVWSATRMPHQVNPAALPFSYPLHGRKKPPMLHLRTDFLYEGDDPQRDGMCMIHLEFRVGPAEGCGCGTTA